MPHKLKNENLEIQIDLPDENYNFSRFDWSGKIAAVKFQNIPLTIAERTDIVNDAVFGKGFYNEFGMDAALALACLIHGAILSRLSRVRLTAELNVTAAMRMSFIHQTGLLS